MRVINLTSKEIAHRLSINFGNSSLAPFSEFPYPESFFSQPPRPAAVLIPFLRMDQEWHLLFTRRNADLPEHSGQVSFPGGRSDPEDDSLETTALRETEEEIGLKPSDVKILGRLASFHTITNYLVTPIIGTIPWPYPLQINHTEVSRAFTIPLSWLADMRNHEIRERFLPEPFQPFSVIYFHPYDGEVLWGATARFTLSLLNSIGLINPSGL